MFKNLMIYRLNAEPLPDLDKIEEALQAQAFVACGVSQEQSMGWVSPRSNLHDAFAESVDGQLILKFRTETKPVPATAVREKADDAAAKIEQDTGRKPGKKEMRDLREEAKLALLPHAFSKFSNVLVWIDREAGLIVMDATSQARADAVISALVQAIPGMAPRLLNTRQTPASGMAQWLTEGEAPGAFQIEREAELKSCGEDRAVVKYGRHTLDIDEVKQHVAQGKLPTKLALNWQGRVAFTLTESMTLKKIGLLETVFEGTSKEKEDNFDADVTIATGELAPLIADLVDALGGELTEFASTPEAEQSTPTQAGGKTVERMAAAAYNPDGDGPDPLIDAARDLVVTHQKGSISFVQRHLKIGYNRAARLLEALEIQGILGPMTSGGMREVRSLRTTS